MPKPVEPTEEVDSSHMTGLLEQLVEAEQMVEQARALLARNEQRIAGLLRAQIDIRRSQCQVLNATGAVPGNVRRMQLDTQPRDDALTHK